MFYQSFGDVQYENWTLAVDSVHGADVIYFDYRKRFIQYHIVDLFENYLVMDLMESF